MWEKALKFMEQYRHKAVYVGCSSGIDSMVLAHFLYENQFNIHILHVNYHMRGEESDGDMEFVQAFCKDRKIPFSIKHFKSDQKGNFQEKARKFRYDFFEESASGNNGVIALAHHADDQVETFFMNLMRRSGITGLACMPAVRENYIRPFLHLSKTDLHKYADKKGVRWREDKSNRSTDYLRNRWRLEFIPLMEETVPELKRSVEILVNAFQETKKDLEFKIKQVSTGIFDTKKLSKERYNSLSSAELFELWRQLKQPSSLFPRFLELKNYPKGKFIEVNSPFVKIINEGTYFSFPEEKTNAVLPTLKITPVDSLPSSFSKSIIYLNPEKLHGKLKIRRWRKGDRISSVGVKGSQLVSQIIKDSKVPHSEREHTLIVCDDKNIHWIVGIKIGKAAVSNIKDARILKVEVTNSTI